MLTTLKNKNSKYYTNYENASNLLVTFLFVLFFFQFLRNFILFKPVNKQIILIQTILILLWYGLSIMIG